MRQNWQVFDAFIILSQMNSCVRNLINLEDFIFIANSILILPLSHRVENVEFINLMFQYFVSASFHQISEHIFRVN